MKSDLRDFYNFLRSQTEMAGEIASEGVRIESLKRFSEPDYLRVVAVAFVP